MALTYSSFTPSGYAGSCWETTCIWKPPPGTVNLTLSNNKCIQISQLCHPPPSSQRNKRRNIARIWRSLERSLCSHFSAAEDHTLALLDSHESFDCSYVVGERCPEAASEGRGLQRGSASSASSAAYCSLSLLLILMHSCCYYACG